LYPILCEVNTLPGGGPAPNPDGYSGWHLGFGRSLNGDVLGIRNAQTNYRLDHIEIVIGGKIAACFYSIYCPTSRASCGTATAIVFTDTALNCEAYMLAWHLYIR